jgi:uncharacterized protein
MGGAESSRGVTLAPMRQASFRFYAELSDCLPAERGDRDFPHSFLLPPSIKDVIEPLGVPHTEVDLILVNGVPVLFSYLVQDWDRASVYPISTAPPGTSVIPLRPQLEVSRFVQDTHLGRLATYLRMLGFDVSYQNRREDAELAHTSAAEDRILLTRDLGLLKRGEVVWGYFVATEPKEHWLKFSAASNCSTWPLRFSGACDVTLCCNRSPKNPSSTGGLHERLSVTTISASALSCDRLYWAGSHQQNMQRFVEPILGTQ